MTLRLTSCIALVAIALGLLFTACDAKSTLSTTITLTNQEIQDKVRAKFPVEKTQNNIKISISNPKVTLDGTRERLVIDTDLTVKLPQVKVGRKGRTITPPALTGKAVVDGDITYDKAAGTVYFANGALKDFKLDQRPAEYNAKVKTMGESSVKSQLNKMTIFALDDSKMEQAAAKQLLQSIKVKDGILEIHLGLIGD